MNGRRLWLAALAALVVLVLVPATAIADPGNGLGRGTAPRLPGKRGESTNWSGYVVQTSLDSPATGAVSDVKAQWTVSAVTSTSVNAYSATWIGIDGNVSKTVEQIGTEADWYNGHAYYSAWYEMYPKRPVTIRRVAIHPGDVISAEVSYAGNRRFTLTLTNVTTGASFTTTQKANADRSSAEWVVEAPSSGSVLPLADFGTQSFTGCSATINGHTGHIDDSLWAFDKIDMVNDSGDLKADVSPLGGGGTTFSSTWISAN